MFTIWAVGTTQENVLPLEGYFAGLGADNTVFVICFNGACGPNGECISPYRGDFCTECDDSSLVLDENFECTTCPATWIAYCILLLVLVTLFVLLTRKSKKTKRAQAATSVFFKIVSSAFTVNSVAISMFSWSSVTDSLLSVEEDVTSIGVSYLDFTCLNPEMENPYFTETLVYGLSPWMLILFVFVVTVVSQYASDRRVKWAEVKNAIIEAAVVIFFLLQGILTKRAAELLSCLKVGPSSDDWSDECC